jgi:hypothetical protein
MGLKTSFSWPVSALLIKPMIGIIVWAVNPNLTLPTTWIAATNQILYFTGCNDRGWLFPGWLAHLLGFGMLESNVAAPGCVRDFELSCALPGGRSRTGTLRLQAAPTGHFGWDERELGLAVTTVELK